MTTKLMQTSNTEIARLIATAAEPDPLALDEGIQTMHPETLASHTGFPDVAPDPDEFEEAKPVELDREPEDLD